MQNIVAIDTETTGPEPSEAKMVELAAVQYEDPDGQWSGLCNPGCPIPVEAMAVHHITDAMVADKIPAAVALSDMRDLMGEPDIWVAHNAQYDRGVLQQLDPSLAQATWICTWRCALHLWPDAPSHSNQVLRYWLKLDLEGRLPADLYPHRALYDTIVTTEILRRMMEEKSAEELVKLSTQPAVLRRVRFGKHRGLTWDQVPRGYLEWCLKQQDMDDDVRHTAMHWLSGGAQDHPTLI